MYPLIIKQILTSVAFGLDQVPNGLGALFGLAQLILHAVYYKSTKQIMAERKRKEVNLSDVVVVVAVDDQPKKKGAIASDQNGHNSDET